jgi:hypothetical protein
MPPPEEIAGQTLQVEYVSPLARAQMAGEANAVNRLYQSILPLAELDPSVMDNVDNDEAVQVLAKGFAVNPKVLRGKDEREELRGQRQQMQAMQQGMALAEQGAGAFKNAGQGQKAAAEAQNVGTGE